MTTTHDHWFQSHLRELSREECFELLRAEVLGRIGFNDDAGPVVLPINYRVHDDSVVIATGWATSLAQFALGKTVALEVEDLDPMTESGRSVLVRGRAELLTDDPRPEPTALPRPWADGPRPLLIRVVPESITGRRLLEA